MDIKLEEYLFIFQKLLGKFRSNGIAANLLNLPETLSI